MKKRNIIIKLILRIIGFSLLIIGLVLTIIGFMNFGNFENNLFSLSAIGLPCLAIGFGMTISSFTQSLARFVKNEHASVINELAEDVSPAIKTYTAAVNDALREQDSKLCSCGNKNPKDSAFCNKCGKKLD